ncbi:uncharacterized protein LOC131956741 [Physella acuta]|uniref:uncharacterized protein LOC131956741 n=1 Tax=Physella acuta TaxID=109671 RepID=UPI0027DB7FBC|nr:uncharacterized protein LOC131956741 [Physella acuta]
MNIRQNLSVVLALVVLGMVLIAFIMTRQDIKDLTEIYRARRNMESDTHKSPLIVSPEEGRFKEQRNELSMVLNNLLMLYGQQSCQILKLSKSRLKVSENGGWCADMSSGTGGAHKWDKGFSKALSKFFKGKTVGSFGDGPGLYKKNVELLGEVKSYTAYDGAPYCETVTNGTVIFLDLTVPQYNLPIFDWVISVEVGEHIPAKFEDIYLDNLARHAREGIVMSWAVPGQGGLSHVNNKPLEEVKEQMRRRGFEFSLESGEPLRKAASFMWLRQNVHVYNRVSPSSLVEEDA